MLSIHSHSILFYIETIFYQLFHTFLPSGQIKNDMYGESMKTLVTVYDLTVTANQYRVIDPSDTSARYFETIFTG